MAKIEILPNALPGTFAITIGTASEVLPPSDNKISKVVFIGPSGMSFSNPATITIWYTDSDLSFLGINTPQQIKVYTYSQHQRKWTEISTITVNEINKSVNFNVLHLSLFAICGPLFASNLLTIRVYPNPFKPYDGKTNTGIPYDGSPNSGIIFDNLTQGCTIKIFNIVGELIFEKEGIAGKYQWDAKNKKGKEVASGVYIYLITDRDNRKASGKIAIIR